MFNWLYENLTFLTMVLGTAAVVLLVLWWQTRLKKRTEMAIERPTQQSRVVLWKNRERKFALCAGAIALLLGAIWLLAVLFQETESGKIKAAIEEMRAGVQARDVERIFQQVSKDFRYRTHGWAEFKSLSSDILRRRDVEDVRFWDFEAEEISRKNRSATVTFKVKPKGRWEGSELFYLCRAEFVLDPDHKWRLKGFKVFNPFVNTKEEIPVPGT